MTIRRAAFLDDEEDEEESGASGEANELLSTQFLTQKAVQVEPTKPTGSNNESTNNKYEQIDTEFESKFLSISQKYSKRSVEFHEDDENNRRPNANRPDTQSSQRSCIKLSRNLSNADDCNNKCSIGLMYGQLLSQSEQFDHKLFYCF
ncbi:MAG: hypothetical protein MHMPM18_001714 [Marteilia pararefringens]